MPARAQVVGVGLIGGSIALALRSHGWHVTGYDLDSANAEAGVRLGALDVTGFDPSAELTFVATPVGIVPRAVAEAIATTNGVVTDAGSVKSPMRELMAEPRYVGGHPMAGSELEGVAGARADLFEGRTWVLTPVGTTDGDAYTKVQSVVSGFGADVVALDPAAHDRMVAVVSHVPHLTAATLMRLADTRSDEHRALLRLAAGGFRDMTRIAAGHPGIWPDICAENREAIVDTLDALIGELQDMRSVVSRGDRDRLVELLEGARSARLNLPARFARPEDLAELRVRIPDRPGEVARITTAASEIGVSLLDLEIAHSAEGEDGVLIMTVELAVAEEFRAGLHDLGYSSTIRTLG